MGLVNVSLNGRPYEIACDDGQEEHVGLLAEMLSDRVTALAETVGQVGESRLLLMAGLLVVDELVEARDELSQVTGGAVPGPTANATHLRDDELAEMINGLAQRIEDIAERLNSA